MSDKPKQYTVQDSTSGKTVTFQWTHPTAPTDADFEDVFKASGLRDTTPQESQQPAQPRSPFQQSVIDQPQAQLQKSEGYFKSNNPDAGIMGFANTGFDQSNALIGASLQAGQQAGKAGALPNAYAPIVNAAVGGVTSAFGKAGEIATKAGLGYLGLVKGHNLGTTPEKANQIRDEAVKLGSNLGAWAGPAAAGMAAGEVGGAYTKAVDTPRMAAGNKAFKEAFRPLKGEINVDESINRGRAYVTQEFRDNPPTPGGETRQFYEHSIDAGQQIYDNYSGDIQKVGETGAVSNIKPIKDALLSNIDDVVEMVNPERAQKLREYVNTALPDELPVAKQDAFIKKLNVETRPYRNAPDEIKYQMYEKNPRLALQVDLADGLRQSMFQRLEDYGAKGVAEARKDYGAVAQLRNMAARNIVSSEAQQPTMIGGRSPLGTGLMIGGELALMAHNPIAGVAGMAATVGRVMAVNNKMKNAKVAKAVSLWSKSSLKPLPYQAMPPPDIKGQLPQGATVTPTPQDVSGIQSGEQPYTNYGVPSFQKALPPGITRVDNIQNPDPTQMRGMTNRPSFPPSANGALVPVFDPRTRQVIYVSPEQAYNWDAQFRLPIQ